MKIELTVLISICTALAGTLLGVISARRTFESDVRKQSRETATIISEIGYVKAGIDDIKRHREKQDERHYALEAKVTRLEAGVQQLQIQSARTS